MKAIQIQRAGEDLKWTDVQTPRPNSSQALIKVEAAGINYADILMCKGIYPLPQPFPLIPGMEVAGTLVEGGQRVVAFLRKGGYAEYALAEKEMIFALPDHVSYHEALALLVQGLTAHFMLESAVKIQPKDVVLVQAAAGGVGSLLIQLLKLYHPALVIGLVSQDTKIEKIKALGASHGVNYTHPDWPESVKRITPRKGVDVLFQMVSGRISQDSFDLLLPFGRAVLFGGASDKQEPLITPAALPQILFKNQTLTGFALYDFVSVPGQVEKALKYLFSLIKTQQLKVVADHVFPLNQAAEAHRQIQERKTVGKVILTIP